MAKSDTEAAPAARLPSTRESRPAMIGLALLLIVGGALASAYLALQSGDRADFVRVQTDLKLGAPLSEADLTRVSLPEGFDDGIPASEMESLVGQYTTVPLRAGTVLTPAMVSEEAGIPAGQVELNIPLESHEFNVSATPGAQVVLTFESADGKSYGVQGTLVDVIGSDEGGLTGTVGETSAVSVSVDDSCARLVGPAILDDEVKVGLLSAEPNSNSVKADCSGMG